MAFESQEPELSNTATRFESGMHNTFGLTGLYATLTLLRSIPISARESQLLTLRSVFEEAGRSAGLLSPDVPRASRSGIICFTHPEAASDSIIRHLRTENVIVNLKNNHIRVSPHVYNNQSDAERFRDAISSSL